jgi:hypothetical protein
MGVLNDEQLWQRIRDLEQHERDLIAAGDALVRVLTETGATEWDFAVEVEAWKRAARA